MSYLFCISSCILGLPPRASLYFRNLTYVCAPHRGGVTIGFTSYDPYWVTGRSLLLPGPSRRSPAGPAWPDGAAPRPATERNAMSVSSASEVRLDWSCDQDEEDNDG